MPKVKHVPYPFLATEKARSLLEKSKRQRPVIRREHSLSGMENHAHAEKASELAKRIKSLSKPPRIAAPKKQAAQEQAFILAKRIMSDFSKKHKSVLESLRHELKTNPVLSADHKSRAVLGSGLIDSIEAEAKVSLTGDFEIKEAERFIQLTGELNKLFPEKK